MSVKLYDTTLRDGSQAEGISFSVEDKLKISKALIELGIHFIEGGWPGSNPKDSLFFKKASRIRQLRNRIVPFGSTRRKGIKASSDANLKALVKAGTDMVTIFGKSWNMHVTHALRATLEENLDMIYDSVKFLKARGKHVVYDAEHFFDGYMANAEYAIKTVQAACSAGADNITLCDTNGGRLPQEIKEIVLKVRKKIGCPLGIHAHNDSELAVANTISAIESGCVLIHGTINGYGERCGNANLCSIIPVLKLKMGHDCISDSQLGRLTEVSLYISEIANMVPRSTQPYVGRSAFAHKGGVHVSAVERHPSTYEHISPELVGNKRRVLISELSGKSNVQIKAKELEIDFDHDPDKVKKILSRVKAMEEKGYQFEGAEGSFELLMGKATGAHRPFFSLKGFRVIVEKDKKGLLRSEATIKVEVDGKEEHTASDGDGPVNALDNALRKALEKFYPQIKEMSLYDFKVRVIDASEGTAAKVRVLIESRDPHGSWGTIGVSENIIEASWQALVDAIEYKLLNGKSQRISRSG